MRADSIGHAMFTVNSQGKIQDRGSGGSVFEAKDKATSSIRAVKSTSKTKVAAGAKGKEQEELLAATKVS